MAELPQSPCQDAVPKSARPALLLIHGFPFDHTMWQAQVDVLSSACRVIAPDLRGFGELALAESDAADGVGMEDYAADLLELLDSLGIEAPVILCGFSMGGYILWQFARRFPQRVRALVLCDTRAAADSAEASAGRLKMAEEVVLSGTDSVAEAMLPKLLAKETFHSRSELVGRVATMIRQASPDAVAAALRGMARRPDVQGELAALDWPALILCGSEDAICPPQEMQAMAKSLPRGKYCEIPAAGHMSPLENSAAFNAALLEFVESL